MNTKDEIEITDSKPTSGRMQRLVRWLFPHCHEWGTTWTNGFYLPTEQICGCGEYRHRVLKADDLPDVAEWKEGRHPESK